MKIASGSIGIGFVAVPIFVAVVWHAAFKTNYVTGRGLFTVIAIEQRHPFEGLGPFVLVIFPLTQKNLVNVVGGGILEVAKLIPLGIDFHL